MNELSLFTGAGGGLLGTHLLGWKVKGYVEFNEYCQRVIRARIDDGILPVAPIFTDVREFIKSGCAEQYRGFIDVVTGGFPCQPFSVAGKRAGADDERNMWPATRNIVRLVRPQYCFFENVPGLLTSGYFGTIVSDLAQSGYCVRWRILSAAEMGAPHKRDRLWIMAHTISNKHQRTQPRSNGTSQGLQSQYRAQDGATWEPSGTSEIRLTSDAHVADAISPRAWDKGGEASNEGWREANAHESTPIRQRHGTQSPSWTNTGSKDVANTKSVHAQGRMYGQRQGELGRSSWWEVEPALDRVVDGVADRVDRLKAIGNGQVSIVAATAWHLLSEGL